VGLLGIKRTKKKLGSKGRKMENIVEIEIESK